MNDFFKKYNIWINVAVFSGSILASFFLFILPLEEHIQNNSDEIQRKEIDRDMMQMRISNIPEMENAQKIFLENEGDLRIRMTREREVDFIQKVESLAEETGNKIEMKINDRSLDQKQKSAPGKKDPDDLKSALPSENYILLGITLEGNYEAMLNFLHKLENMSYYVNVISLNLTRADQEDEKKIIQNNIFGKASPEMKVDKKKILRSILEAVVYLEE